MNRPISSIPALGISAVATVDRTGYGIDTMAGPIGTDVSIEIEAEFLMVQQSRNPAALTTSDRAEDTR